MDVDEVTLRSALGVDVSKWDTAGVLAFSLRQIDMLQYMNDGNKARACKWIVQQFYHILFQKFGKSLVDNKRRCAWYFNSDVPAHDHQIPDNFDMIRLVPKSHYICFYDTSSAYLKPKYIAKLDIKKPHHRQRLFDIRHAQPKVRQRLLKWTPKSRTGKQSLLKQTLKKSLPATGLRGKSEWDAQNTATGTAGTSQGETNQGSGSLDNTPSNPDMKDPKDSETAVDKDMEGVGVLTGAKE